MNYSIIRTPVHYRLICLQKSNDKKTFLIVCTCQDECSVVYAGEDLLQAESLYHKLLDGCVTPCTLQDIVDDMGDHTRAVSIVAQNVKYLEDTKEDEMDAS